MSSIDDGIGAGLILNGAVFRGHHGAAGEFGHMVLDEDGALCRCGNRGCLETLAGGQAIVESVRTGRRGLKLHDVVVRAIAGDSACIRAIADAGRHLGIAAGNLSNVFDPERIAVGGELSQAGELLLGPMRHAMERSVIVGFGAGCRSRTEPARARGANFWARLRLRLIISRSVPERRCQRTLSNRQTQKTRDPTIRAPVRAIASAVLIVLALSGCGLVMPNTGADGSRTIALLLPESKTARYEAYDRPFFEAKVAELCPECDVIYANADQDPAKQQQQAESAFAQGISVLVLDPVDSSAAVTIVATAQSYKVPVISYDRLIGSPELAFWVSFDNEKVGALQGKALVERLADQGLSSGNIVMINGSPTDNNSRLFKRGAHNVIDGSAFTVVAEFDTPDWSPDKAQEWMASQVTPVRRQPGGGLRRQRRHGRRSNRRAQSGRSDPAASRHRSGCRTHRDSAHRERRPVHDHLQGPQA